MHYVEGINTLKAGEYKFDEPASALQVRRRIVRATFMRVRWWCRKAINIYDIAAVVEQAGLGPAADFMTAAQGDLFLLRDIDPSAKSLEGYLFPDTYQFTRIDSAHDIAAAMVRRFRRRRRRSDCSATPICIAS